MYFSSFNKRITYSNEWGGVLHVCGEGMLRRNAVLVRGWKGTFAERFALENGLKFRHADIMIGWSHGD